MIRLLSAFAALLLACAPASAQDRGPPGQTTGPLRIQRSGTSGDTSNPYAAGGFPSWAAGVGQAGTGYPDTKPLATSTIYAPGGSATFTNPFPYGSLNTTGAGTFSVGVNRPGCVAGFTDPSQSSAYDEFGSYALCAQGDTVPLMAAVAGTFTATTFVPSSPITLSDTVKLGVGMWIRTNDSPAAYNGRITGWATNGSGQVTSITVSGWYKRGGGAGTPTGTRAYINPLDKLWGFLLTPFGNGIRLTGSTTAGSTAVPVSSTAGLYPKGQIIAGPGIPTGTVINDIDYAGSTVYLERPATATGSNVQLIATSGTEFGKFVGAELDIFNDGVDFAPVWISGVTGDTTAGDYVVRNVGNISAWRSGLIVYGSGIPVGATVTGVNVSTNEITLKYPATATATGVALRGINQLDEGGTGIDCLGVLKNSNTCYLQRGSVSYGFVSMGAGNTSFLVQPDMGAGLPHYGFRVDGKINGHPSVADFAVTNHDTVLWKIDGSGNETVQSVDSATGYKVGGATVLDNAAWTAYTPTVACAAGGSLTAGTVTARYKQIGKTVTVTVKAPLTANTCSGGVNVTLPLAAAVDAPLYGRDIGTGTMLAGLAPGGNSFALVQTYAGGVPSAGGVLFGLTYETP